MATRYQELKTTLKELGVPFKGNASADELEELLKAQEHVITQEDLDNNPDLVAEGIEVGETIHLPFADDAAAEQTLDETPGEESSEGEGVDEEDEDESPVTAPAEAGDYEVVLSLKHDGMSYKPGDTVALTSEQAERLLKTKTVRVIE